MKHTQMYEEGAVTKNCSVRADGWLHGGSASVATALTAQSQGPCFGSTPIDYQSFVSTRLPHTIEHVIVFWKFLMMVSKPLDV